MGTPYIGEIRMFAGNFAPLGWAFCDGTLLAISQNEALFNLIGTTYGGDGESTFALPDLRGRIPVHAGQGPGLTQRIFAESGGAETVTLTPNQMPSHSHSLLATANPAMSSSTAFGSLLAVTADTPIYGAPVPAGQMNNAAVQPAGGTQPHDNMAPSLCVSFIIALEGIFPSPS
jgi:microcystin-dependent protein